MTEAIPYRQSFIKTFRLCPEAARLDLRGELEDLSSDATHMGSALHLVAEHALKSIIAKGGWSQAEATEVGRKYLNQCEKDGVRLVKQTSWDAVRKRFEKGVRQWFWWLEDRIDNGMLNPDTEQWKIEYQFEFQWGEFLVQGTTDFFDGWNSFDWKTGKIPQDWEMQRWDAQSVVYTEALVKSLNLEEPPGFIFVYPSGREMKDEHGKLHLPFPFELVMAGPHQHRGRVYREMQSIQTVIDRYGLDEQWPLRIDTWYCSEKWCANWHNCIGATFTNNNTEGNDNEE